MSAPAVWLDDFAQRALPGVERALASAGALVMRTFARTPNPAVVAHFEGPTQVAVVGGRQSEELLSRIELATTTLRIGVIGVVPQGGQLPASLRLPGLVDLIPAGTRDAARRILLMASVPIVSSGGRTRAPQPSHPPVLPSHASAETVVAIASSTGGSWVLADLLLGFDRANAGPVLVAQHLEGEFVPFFAQWLEETTRWPVRIVDGLAPLTPGVVHLAQGGKDLCAARDGASAHKPNSHFVPSADRLFHSVARAFGPHATGVVLSGMGSDGAEGLADLVSRGGRGFCQSPNTAVIPSMPEQALQRARGAISVSPALLASTVFDG
jgi:chemotaxis response regulator CheB